MSSELQSSIINGNEIRVFSDQNLQAAIDRVTSNLPPDAHGAVVAHGDLTGASLSIVGKVDEHWTVVAAAYKPWTGPLEAEADVRYSW